MPDITVSFTDAQWARVVAASSSIKRIDESGDVDADYLSEKFKKLITDQVTDHERREASIDDF
jgi:hypothetical protein